MADLRFGMTKGSTGGGTGKSASVTMTNVSSRKCTMFGYLALRWLDAEGNVIPIKVVLDTDPQTPHTIAVPPGATATAMIMWDRYTAAGLPCPPFPAMVEVRLPDQSQAARVAWIEGDDGGLCGATALLRPVDIRV